MIKNKKGWIKIVEAFVAVLLVTGVILISINQGYIGQKDISSEVYEMELSILREIELNDTLRNYILNVIELPANWDDESFPQEVKNKINARTPNYLNCEGKICEISDTCDIEKYFDKNIYAQSVTITTTLTQEEPKYRKLKLFCWTG
ncbi:hypothetical protein KAR52_02395 [Candidatus Pacearchaeota archaeon]|nr:hypothetical protein [Candidatus Pacearchaeota archaeon]